MRSRVALLSMLPALGFPQNLPMAEILQRVAEEAEVFRSAARDVVSEETLTHRWLKPASRFRPRVGLEATQAPKPKVETREVVSEYAFGALKESHGVLHEFRQVVSVDGRKVAAVEKARKALALNVRSEDDLVKKQMLRDFEKLGLKGSVTTDFGQLLLLFSKRRLEAYQFDFKGESLSGADAVLVLGYEERKAESLTMFAGRDTVRQAMKGELWVRKEDYLPVRITLATRRPERDYEVEIEAVVEYAPAAFGVVMPASVVHRESAKGVLLTENTFRYAPFKKFSAEAELKFDVQEPK